MKVVAFLPAKATSERLPSKNTKILFGKPLFLHNLEKLLSSKLIDEVYLDSESDHILNMYDHLPYKKFKRNVDLANNDTDGNVLFYNECKDIKADIYLQISATAPLLSLETIELAILTLQKSNEFDSVVCAKQEKLYIWSELQQPLYDVNHIPNSKDLKDTYIENMSLYAITKEAALSTKRRIGNRTKLLFVDKIESIDIDHQEDFLLAESVLLERALKEQLRYEKMKHLLTSELLSDIFDELGIENRLIHLNCNLPTVKLMGRAKTIRLKRITSDNYEMIYDAINYYEYINFNNILCVENEAEGFAYYGELNALMSIDRGCLGTIIDGTTRDQREVTGMNYPVFYKNNKCKDVKYKAVLDYYDKPIYIQNVQIYPDDLIYADHEGILVFPRNQEKFILDKALDNYLLEKKIAADFAADKDIRKYKF